MNDANSAHKDEEHVDITCDNFILPDVMIKKEGEQSAGSCSKFMCLPTTAKQTNGEITVKEEKPEPRKRILKKIKINNKPFPGPLISPSEIKAEKVDERETVSSNVKVKEEPMEEETSDIMDQSHSEETEETSEEDVTPGEKNIKKNESLKCGHHLKVYTYHPTCHISLYWNLKWRSHTLMKN